MKALKLTLKDVLSQGRDNLVARITTSSLKKIGVGPITTKKYFLHSPVVFTP